MSLLNRINLILRKLDDPDCFQIAEKEIKSLIVNEIDTGEKLNTFINAIAEEKNYKHKKTLYTALRIYGAIAEIFQHQIIEFLPKIFSILNKKILASDETVYDFVAEAYAALIEYSFKGADSEDADYIYKECLKQLFDLFDNKAKTVHICTGLCIKRIIQNDNIGLVENNYEDIYKNLIAALKTAKEKYTVLEAILSLIICVSNKTELISEDVTENILNYVGDANYKTRKVCIDIIYAILSIDTDMLKTYNEQIYKILQELKTDKNRFVRETAMECINIVSSPNKSTPKNKNARVKSAIPKMPADNNQKFVRKTSAKFVNKKLNLEHVTSTIDKAKMNQNFSATNNKNNGFDMPVVLVKEPTNIENYKKMQQMTEENLIKYKNEQNHEAKKNVDLNEDNKQNGNDSIDRKQSDDDKDNKKMQIEETIDKVHMLEETNEKIKDTDLGKPISVEQTESSDKKEIENLKKYIKILNGKVKELYTTCNNLTKTNNELTGKVVSLEQNYAHLYSLVQRNNYKSQDTFFNESQSNMNANFATPNKGIPMMAQNTFPCISPNMQPVVNTENNKWFNKTTNINTKLFNILATNNDETFFNFLRDSSNFNNFNTIDHYLIDQLYSKLVELLTKTANDNSIVAEYALKWLHLFLDSGIPENENDSKKLQSLLFYLSNNVDDTFLREKVGQLLNHDYFSGKADDFSSFSNTRRLREEY